MLIYRGLLRVEPACAGKRIQQHVIVLGEGRSPSRIDEPPDLVFAFETHYVRDLDPARALAQPLTAPWAMLAGTLDRKEREARLIQILRTASSVDSKSLSRDLTRITLAFAAIVMKREDIKGALREAGMTIDNNSELTWADELHAEGHAEGLIEGRLQGAHDDAVRLLVHRGVDEQQAKLIADALIRQAPLTAAERAAFDDPDELIGLLTER
ncbi:hypothetical protein Q0Z83_084510 [Actinoplanes sichuanensis]|nr:hypothetical protein Q0Z83_084510 [Actinoplanes sichuanensis]